MIDDRTLKTDITQLWDRIYVDYDDCYAHGIKSDREREEWKKLLDSLVREKHSRILDVGAGTGFLSMFLAELGHEVKGIDLSENMLSRAKKKADMAGYDNVVFAIADAEKTGEKSSSYDVIVNRHLVWTLPHPKKAIKEWKRVLKPGGKLIIIEGNWYYNRLSDRIQVFLGKCLLSIQERRNAFINDGDYQKEVKKSLPMMKSRNAKQLARMVKEDGFQVTVVKPKQVDKAEKAAMPLATRLMNPHKRIVIVGIKE